MGALVFEPLNSNEIAMSVTPRGARKLSVPRRVGAAGRCPALAHRSAMILHHISV
jgi:hypothetical protein